MVDIPTLAGEKIPLNLANEVIRPNTVKRIPGMTLQWCNILNWTLIVSGYGLPLSKEPSKKGDILVTFDIQFPEKLSQNAKDLLHDLLPNKWSVVLDFCLIYFSICNLNI